MRIPKPLTCASAVALAGLANPSFSQTPPAPPPPDMRGPPSASGAVYDPQQFPSIRGEVERFSLTARGDIDGVILKDGTEVKTSPDLSTQIAFAIKPGDRVTIHGLRAAALPLVRAVSISDDVTRRTVSDSDVATPMNPPPPPRGAPPPPLGVSSEVSGRVRMALHGPQGEVNGVLLDSGATLRFPPDQAEQLAAVIQPRQPLVAEGIAVTNSLGTVVEVQRLGPSRDRLVAVGPPMPPMGDRRPADPRRGPAPFPDGGPRAMGPAAPAAAPSAPGELPPPPPPDGGPRALSPASASPPSPPAPGALPPPAG